MPKIKLSKVERICQPYSVTVGVDFDNEQVLMYGKYVGLNNARDALYHQGHHAQLKEDKLGIYMVLPLNHVDVGETSHGTLANKQ